ncbi:MAG: hypothetical protein BWX66_00034 [Deltaproteobacteria bacterium ADurb.Bin058]|jgi:hypothetical protein|nr:MAG: hypothetical protein BWX66_00034 [Deltaproteobacteria bacterium ADurb.Bin058]
MKLGAKLAQAAPATSQVIETGANEGVPETKRKLARLSNPTSDQTGCKAANKAVCLLVNADNRALLPVRLAPRAIQKNQKKNISPKASSEPLNEIRYSRKRAAWAPTVKAPKANAKSLPPRNLVNNAPLTPAKRDYSLKTWA